MEIDEEQNISEHARKSRLNDLQLVRVLQVLPVVQALLHCPKNDKQSLRTKRTAYLNKVYPSVIFIFIFC